jgi:alkylhydroperoxidase/carboxymuconolactone decarboxylase family protein YurZ
VSVNSEPATKEVDVESLKERKEERRRLAARTYQGPMKVVPGFQALGKAVFADGAISKKHKELMALAVAVSQNCFE